MSEPPSYMGRTFISWCHFWVIMLEVTRVYSTASDTPLVERLSFPIAERKYQERDLDE